MVPSIAQQLQSLRNTMAETIIPALPADAGFAQEQAGLMVATLDWLTDVQAHAYRYEAAENATYRELLEQLAPLAGDDGAEVRDALAAAGPPAPGELMGLPEISAQNEAFKTLAGRLFAALTEGTAAAEARELMLRAAQHQGEREAAWFRMTGFPNQAGEIGAVLAT